jgi:hypothetical protein
MSIGSLMRTVRSKKYENITDDLSEVEQIKERVPEIEKFISHIKKKRDASRLKHKRSRNYDTPAQKMYRTPFVRRTKEITIAEVKEESDCEVSIPKTSTTTPYQKTPFSNEVFKVDPIYIGSDR